MKNINEVIHKVSSIAAILASVASVVPALAPYQQLLLWLAGGVSAGAFAQGAVTKQG